MRNAAMTIWVTELVLCLTTSQVVGLTQFNDGQTYNINYGINDEVWVDYELPSMQTTVNFLNGGSIDGDNDLYAYEDSRINISGGAINDYLYIYDRSQVNMSSGSVSDVFQVYDNSQVTISGGTLGWGLCAHNNSHVNISGGSGGHYLHTFDSGQIIFSGGSIVYDLTVEDNSQVTFSGGSIGREMRVGDDGVLTIEGSGFAVDGQPFGYGELTSVYGGSYGDEYNRNLTGTLTSGDPIDTGFRIGNNAKIVLAPPPPTFTLTIDVDPNDVGIDTITPSVGTHNYGGWVSINAERFVNCPDVYRFDHWQGDVTNPNSSSTTINMDANKSATAFFVDGRQCGDECHPYPAGDISKNCIVDFNDFALFCQSWLECTKPECD